MFKKIWLLAVFTIATFGAAQARETAQHYFEITMNLYVNSSPSGTPAADWADVTLSVNGDLKTVHFVAYPGMLSTHRFPINEIDMNQNGMIKIIEVKYHELATDTVYTMPLADQPMCRIEITEKNDHQQSSVLELYMSHRNCNVFYTAPYTE